MRTRQSGVDLPHSEARLQAHCGAQSRFEEESRVAADGFCARKALPAPQAAGPARGVVSPKAENGPEATHKTANTTRVSRHSSATVPQDNRPSSYRQKQTLIQSFLKRV